MRAKYKPYIKKSDYSYVFGVYPTIACLEQKPNVIKEILLHSASKKNEGIEKVHALAKQNHIPIQYKDKEIAALATEATYAIAVIQKYTQTIHQTNHIILDHPSDMGNIGTIMRTMLGFEMHDLAIIAPAVDIFHPKVIRASMGAMFSLRIQTFSNIESYRKQFSNKLYGFSLLASNTLQQITFQSPYALVFGNEGAGLSEETSKEMNLVKIPQSDEIDSFALPISVAIALYHISTSS